MSTVGIIGHAIASVAFLTLTLMLLVSRRKNNRGGLLILASAVSAIWALVAVHQSTDPVLFWNFGGVMDSVRILAWSLFLYSLVEQRACPGTLVGKDASSNGTKHVYMTTSGQTGDDAASVLAQSSISTAPANTQTVGGGNEEWSGVRKLRMFITAILVTHLGLWIAALSGTLEAASLVRLIAALWILASLTAFLSLERFVRATPQEKRPTIRYLVIGLGTMFLFDFIVSTDAQLFSRINTNLWFARGFIYALMVPLIALTIVRNPQWSVTLHVSRQAVTSSITAIACGAYLLITALAAYFVRFSGVQWASVAEVVVILVAIVIFALLGFSTHMRSRIKVAVSKHLFNFKYDYRHEWLNFTETLASNIGDTSNAILQGLTGLVDSDGGTLWRLTDNGRVETIATRGNFSSVSISESDASAMQKFMLHSQWLIDLDEVRKYPERYEGMILTDTFLENDDFWLVLPLMFRDELIASLLFKRSSIQKDINWEDRDLLKTAGRQAATLLKQEETQLKLSEASQFQAFSKLSAYIVHDLKNIIGQQSLLVSNAARHKHNPEFVDDVITTVDNSVKRMQALLEQLRSNRTEEQSSSINLVDALKNVVSNRGDRKPAPTLHSSHESLLISAEWERLQRVFGHLVQNAQEATPDDGTVSIDITKDRTTAIVRVRDTGSGMSLDFISNSLFKAFESTKGLTGMGIGVFESREYVKSLGGEISVSSELGVGTDFQVRLPLLIQNT